VRSASNSKDPSGVSVRVARKLGRRLGLRGKYVVNDLLHITGGIRSATNPFGHTAPAIEGDGLYSYGTGTPLESDPLPYIKDQSQYRDQLITLIRTTPQQDASVMDFFDRYLLMNGVGIVDNCSIRTGEALWAARIPIEGSPFPGGLSRQTASLPNVQTWFIPRGAAIPSDLADIARQRFSPRPIP
jgi:hypothetical protein